jgi:hypothetical protein
METATIITLATEVAGVINKLLSNMPTQEQKSMDAFFKFLDSYETELKKADADFDRILLMRQRKELLLDTVIQQLRKGRG